MNYKKELEKTKEQNNLYFLANTFEGITEVRSLSLLKPKFNTYVICSLQRGISYILSLSNSEAVIRKKRLKMDNFISKVYTSREIYL